MKKNIFGLIVLLMIAHQDYWWWDSIDPLVLGFIPISLAYHAGVSMAAALLWALAIKYCWPTDVTDDNSNEASIGNAGNPRNPGANA